jgi:enoyl-[acyl-carrier protein] reductase III
VCAGAIETDIWRAIPDGERLLEAARTRTPAGGLVTAEAVAEVVHFLASPAAQSIQGQIIVADGGYSLLA